MYQLRLQLDELVIFLHKLTYQFLPSICVAKNYLDVLHFLLPKNPPKLVQNPIK